MTAVAASGESLVWSQPVAMFCSLGRRKTVALVSWLRVYERPPKASTAGRHQAASSSSRSGARCAAEAGMAEGRERAAFAMLSGVPL